SDVDGFTDCWLSGSNFIVRRVLLLGLGLFSPKYGMIGDEPRMGEERALMQVYRAKFSNTDRRIYYSNDLVVFHLVPKEKMRVRYRLRRSFQAGKASMRRQGVQAPS